MRIPFGERFALTIPDASEYFGIDERKLREMTSREDCTFVLWVGSKRLIKRAALEVFIEEHGHLA